MRRRARIGPADRLHLRPPDLPRSQSRYSRPATTRSGTGSCIPPEFFGIMAQTHLQVGGTGFAPGRASRYPVRCHTTQGANHMTEQAWPLDSVIDLGHAQDGSQVWFKLKMGGTGQDVPLIMTPQTLQSVLASLHQVAQSADRHRQETSGQGRPQPMPLIEIQKTEAIDLFDPAWRGIRAHIRNSSTMDFCLSPMTAAQLANQLKVRPRSKPHS